MTVQAAGAGSPTENRIVIVDDDEFIHERVARNLRVQGWSLESFTEPEVALAHLQRDRLPKVLVVDNRMPRVEGVEFLERLGSDADLSACRAYLCSSVRPPAAVLTRIAELGVRLLSKDTLCDKNGLSRLLEAGDGAHETG